LTISTAAGAASRSGATRSAARCGASGRSGAGIRLNVVGRTRTREFAAVSEVVRAGTAQLRNKQRSKPLRSGCSCKPQRLDHIATRYSDRTDGGTGGRSSRRCLCLTRPEKPAECTQQHQTGEDERNATAPRCPRRRRNDGRSRWRRLWLRSDAWCGTHLALHGREPFRQNKGAYSFGFTYSSAHPLRRYPALFKTIEMALKVMTNIDRLRLSSTGKFYRLPNLVVTLCIEQFI